MTNYTMPWRCVRLALRLSIAFDIRIERVLQDMWIGAYWRTSRRPGFLVYQYDVIDLYICLIPCYPIHVKWWRIVDPPKRQE